MNGHSLGASTFQAQLRTEMSLRAHLTKQARVGLEAQLGQEVLERMIDDELVSDELARRQAPIRNAEIRDSVDEWRARFRTDAELEAFIAERYGDEQHFEADLRRSLARTRLMELATPDPAATSTSTEATARQFDAWRAFVQTLREGAHIERFVLPAVAGAEGQS